jgi:uncharacterized protein DUF6159
VAANVLAMFRRALELMRASWRVMWAEQALVLLAVAPLVTFCGVILVESAIAALAPPAAVVMLLPAIAFVIFMAMFWSAAIVSAANQVAEGSSPTVAGAAQDALDHVRSIAAWACYSFTVGIAIRLFGSLLGRFGAFVTYAGETAWSVATMLVLPAIVIDGWTPADARRHSREMLSATWATSLTGQLGFDLVAAVAVVPALLVVVLAALLDNGPLMGIAILLAFASFIAAALAVSACLSVYRTMLYRHVNGRQLPLAFEASPTFQASVRPAPAAARTTIAFGSRPVRSR